ncbi:diacylglycerol kinase family protein [Sphingomonas sp. SUN039]|uniref:diacylglycerol/lipid kinase family protein n=1 Tax=Sphingomonas sp. SUN039 TaxID=2937787 RepID=UPI00216466F2|nr:diacylglycerol kinase family protein [Sphingomonas sp. SUN039]UVO53411.1 diacylglycerol kinase [Sphingomonas sp. SUN039]
MNELSSRAAPPLPTSLPRSATLIVNAQSRRGRDLFDQAKSLIEARGITLDAAHALDKPDRLVPTVKAAVAGGTKMVVIGGGDGTLSSAVDLLVGKDVVFALLPLGTANSFARSTGIPLDLEAAVDVIADGRRARVDLGMIDLDYFCNVAAIGLAPLIAETIPHGLKRWLGRIGYLSWVAVSLFRFRAFTLVVNGEAMEATEVRIANGRFQGGTELIDDADPQSGEIVVQAVRGSTRFGLMWSWIASVLRLPHRHATTRDFHGRELRIETIPPLPISIDGEVLAHTPVTARVAAKAIEMALPR